MATDPASAPEAIRMSLGHRLRPGVADEIREAGYCVAGLPTSSTSSRASAAFGSMRFST